MHTDAVHALHFTATIDLKKMTLRKSTLQQITQLIQEIYTRKFGSIPTVFWLFPLLANFLYCSKVIQFKSGRLEINQMMLCLLISNRCKVWHVIAVTVHYANCLLKYPWNIHHIPGNLSKIIAVSKNAILTIIVQLFGFPEILIM